MKYLYTPYDVAIFLIISNFTQSDERAVLRDIWENDRDSISVKYRKDEVFFRRHVHLELSKYDGTLDELDELNLLMRDTSHMLYIDGVLNEQGVVEEYFKIIKLELVYSKGKDYRKIKLRRLLKAFGYKRRSTKLVDGIRRTLDKLELKTYLRGYVPCDIAEIGIDDTVIIRVK